MGTDDIYFVRWWGTGVETDDRMLAEFIDGSYMTAAGTVDGQWVHQLGLDHCLAETRVTHTIANTVNRQSICVSFLKGYKPSCRLSLKLAGKGPCGLRVSPNALSARQVPNINVFQARVCAEATLLEHAVHACRNLTPVADPALLFPVTCCCNTVRDQDDGSSCRRRSPC